MAPLTVTIRNYRCIAYRRPLTFELRDGTTFLLGLNNAGKTTILRMFSELRPILKPALAHGTANINVDKLYADSILNQSSPENQLELTFSREGNSVKIIVEPGENNRHSNNFKVSTQHGKSGANDATSKIVNDARNLFERSMLVPPYRTTLAAAPQGHFQDLYLGNQLVQKLDQWSSGANVEHRKETRIVIERLRNLFGFKTFNLVASSDHQHVLVTTDDGDFRLDELGNGIAHFIVVLLNVLFLKPDLVLVDEPELGLHPRMQQEFVRCLAAQASHGLICASHSIGLARSAGDRILHVNRADGGGIQVADFGTRHPTIGQVLHELGYSSFVEIGGNNILLVEGQTEIRAFREILRKFGIEHHFILWHLGGGALIKKEASEELDEVRRSNARNVFVIFDSERTNAGDPLKTEFQDFQELCEQLGFIVFPTDFHSTENYVSQCALDAEFGTGRYQALTAFQEFKSMSTRWAKNQNWKLFGRMRREDLEKTGLGKFIQEKLFPACNNLTQLSGQTVK